MIYCQCKLSLRHFIQVYNMTVFALFFGFKMSDCMVIVSKEAELSNNPLQLANIHISHI